MEEGRTEIVPIIVNGEKRLRIEARVLGGAQKVGALGAQPIQDIMTSIESIANALGETLKKIGPQKAAVEFGIEVGVEAGKLTALICRGSGRANLKLTL